MPTENVNFKNQNGYTLSGKIEWPVNQKPIAFAIFAHVFTGNKNLAATRNISRALTLQGIAVLRFDFTGLGESEGAFKDSSFSSNVNDLLAARDYLVKYHEAPQIIVGHSLGGAASIFAASKIESIKAVATIGAPSEPVHVKHLLHSKLDDIKREGSAIVSIGGQDFTIKREFLEDLENNTMKNILPHLNKALLVLHSPQDDIVGIENAAYIYDKALHPKSFVTLNGADHMLTNKDDAYYTGNVIASWAKRYINYDKSEIESKANGLVCATIDPTSATTSIMAGAHGFIADTSEQTGGQDFGPSPYQLLASALASSTTIFLKNYAVNHKINFTEIIAEVDIKSNFEEDYTIGLGRVPHLKFNRNILIKGLANESDKLTLLNAAAFCPVYQHLVSVVGINTEVTSQ